MLRRFAVAACAVLLASTLTATLALIPAAVAGDAPPDLAKAKEAVQKKAWDEALALLQKVVEATPDSKDAAVLATKVYTDGGLGDAFVLAEDALNAAIQKDAKDREAHLDLGRLYLAKGRLLATDPGAGSSVAAWFADADTQFRTVLDASGGVDEDAAAGLVQSQHLQGAFDKAIASADEFLAKRPTSPKVNFWKGQALYLQATDAWTKEGGAASTRAKELFNKAKGAYEASVKGDATNFDAWLQLAYASQYAGDVPGAAAAYEKAMNLDATNEMPMKGIAALYANEPAKYQDTLERLAKDKPAYLPARYYLGWAFLSARKYDDAVRVLSAYVKDAPEPGAAMTWLGQAYEGKGDAGKAMETYFAALKANPDSLEAASAVDQSLIAEFRGRGAPTVKWAQDLIEAYKPLLKAAPKNPFVRNDLGLQLREAAGTGAKRTNGDIVEVDAKWLPFLKESAKVYDEAASLIGEWRPDMSSLPWATRYDDAGTINDAGLMFWYYPQIRDVAKAEKYYQRALDFTDGSYRDALTNLVRLYEEKGEFDEAYRVATDGAEAVKDKEGKPDTEGRALLEGKAKQLVDTGKVKKE
jgi:Flp pilus assembly protein TadD